MQSGKDRYAADEVFTIVNGSLLFRVWRTGIVLHMLLQVAIITKNLALEHITLDKFRTFLTSASNYFELNHFGSQSSNHFVLTQSTVNTNYGSND